MSIKKIFGNQMVPPPVKAGSAQKAGKGSSEVSRGDKVDFSSVLQNVSKARGAANTADAQRAEKVASLKAQISSGTYRPDLEKVAESLLTFIREDV